MMKRLLAFFSPPVFSEDEAKTRSARYLNIITLFSLGLLVALLTLTSVFSKEDFSQVTRLIFFSIMLVFMLVFALLKYKVIDLASYLLVFTVWIAVTLLAINGNGTIGNQAARYIVVIAFIGLVLSYETAIWMAFLSISVLASTSYLQYAGIITIQKESALTMFAQASIPVILSTVFIYLSISSLQKAFREVKTESLAVSKKNEELKELRASLEMAVSERTKELQKANAQTKRRSAQFQTIAQITQKIASERDLDALLSIITEVISLQFQYPHVGIYLNDDMQEYTVLSASSSREGKQMIERHFKLPINQTSAVGYAAETGMLRTSAEAAEQGYISGAEISSTQSQVALPLTDSKEVIGVLDIQSDIEGNFDPIDIEALTAVANQVTIAIQNTRLFTETQTALAESQLLYGTVVKQAWHSAIRATPQVGYRYAGIKPIPLPKESFTAEMLDALENDNIAVTHPSRRKKENAVAVPLRLRESTIGVLNVNFPTDVDVEEDEIDVILAAAQRVALALENASLLEESQRLAQREQTISEMSSKIGSGTEIDTILKTAIEEISRHISNAQIAIEIESQDELVR